MQEVVLNLMVLLAGLPALSANDPEDKDSPFYYGENWSSPYTVLFPSRFLLDWYRLRVGGLICAAVLCALGIIVLMSGKCKCKFRQKPSHRAGEVPPLIAPGSAYNC
ncbi:FXYD domain-containing ion transport regulator 3 [Rhynchocyon petersi]